MGKSSGSASMMKSGWYSSSSARVRDQLRDPAGGDHPAPRPARMSCPVSPTISDRSMSHGWSSITLFTMAGSRV
ncbi:MAG: hypothetical protein MZV64_29565 [Ignavibacteriales bacterium]|nr:hypothetical protein [Ignavibacteriales bacterium]